MAKVRRIEIPRILTDTVGGGAFPVVGKDWMTEPLNEAIKVVSQGRKFFTVLDVDRIRRAAAQWEKHPDVRKIERWLGKREAPPEDSTVVFWLSIAVRNEWEKLPRRTKAQHRALYKRIETLCTDLEEALKETGHTFLRSGGWGMQDATVVDLMTDPEIATADDVMAGGTYSLGNFQLYSIFPKMEDLLARFAVAAKQLSSQGPAHNQPNKRGAERGYFVRRMSELFFRRYEESPADVIAAVTTIALSEPTDRELVAKLLKRGTLY